MSQELDDILTANRLPAVRINTNELYPAIKQGWYAIIEPDKAPSIGEYVLVKFSKGHRSIKLLLEIKHDGYLLQSVTGEDRTFAMLNELEGEAVAIVGIVPPGYLTIVSHKIH